MAITPAVMAQMDDGHLLAAVDSEFDPLTRTPLETELLKRLEAKIDETKDLGAKIEKLIEARDVIDDFITTVQE